MKANLKKTKELHQLSNNALQRIYDQMDEELVTAQFIMMKVGALAWADLGKPKEDIYEWLGGFQRFYRQNSRFETQGEMIDFIDGRLESYFGKDGFPEEYLQSFRNIGRK